MDTKNPARLAGRELYHRFESELKNQQRLGSAFHVVWSLSLEIETGLWTGK